MLILERIFNGCSRSATLKSRPVFIKTQNYKVRRLYFARFHLFLVRSKRWRDFEARQRCALVRIPPSVFYAFLLIFKHLQNKIRNHRLFIAT